jgi:peroxiredoxin
MQISKIISLPSIKGDTWLNSPPLNPHALKGQVVLVYFWHYADTKAQNEILELKKLWAKYNQFGLNIIGVHSPEFNFETKQKNLESFLNENRIYWPIVIDNNFENWEYFQNQYWLSKFLSDGDGRIIFHNPGGGKFNTIERRIQEALQISFPIESSPGQKETWHKQLQGYEQNQLENQGGALQNCIKDFRIPSPGILLPNQIYLKGKFLAESDHFESIDNNSELIVQLNAKQANFVLESLGERCVLEVFFEDKKLETLLAGDKVKNGICVVNLANSYQIFKANHPVVGKLKIKATEGAYKLFSLETNN